MSKSGLNPISIPPTTPPVPITVGPSLLPVAGGWITPPMAGVSVGSMAPADSTLYAIAMLFYSTWPSLKSFGMGVLGTAASAGGVARVGLYADNGSQYPGNLIVDAGTMATTAPNTNPTIALPSPYTVTTPQIIWLAYCAQGAPTTLATVSAANGGSPLPVLSALSSSAAKGGSYVAGYRTGATVSGALPSTFPVGATALTNAPGGSSPIFPVVTLGF